MRNFNLHIISPSSYGNDGRLLQYYRVIMQPAVFPVLKSLAMDACKKFNIDVHIHGFNERLEKGDDYLQHIIAEQNSAKTNMVWLSAKSFELPRAIDIADQLKQNGLQVVIGGPGPTLTNWKVYNHLVKTKISFNVGEGELTVRQIIEDALVFELKPAYWQKGYINLRKAPLPTLSSKEEHAKSFSHLAGIDAGRGCPFNCDFCCVTTLCGRKMTQERSRDSEDVIEWVENTHRAGLPIMFLDDNFLRGFNYQVLKEELIKLNEKLNKKLYLFVQLDVGHGLLKEISNLARMGIKQVFLGLESVDIKALSQEGKRQNRPKEYAKIVAKFHECCIFVSSGWMIGFFIQTPESIKKEALSFSQLVDLAHPYFLTPLEGSRDYADAVVDDSLLTWDPNAYNTMTCVRNNFQNMNHIHAQKAYQDAIRYFFSWSHICGSSLKGHASLDMRWRLAVPSIYGMALARWGKRPFHFMMEGPPQRTHVWRPKDSFRGFALTTEDLEKREQFLMSITK